MLVKRPPFVTSYELFEYTVPLLGLCNAPSMFQKLMNVVISCYIDDFVLVYLDDKLIYSDNAEEQKTHLQQVFDRLCEHKL